MPPKKRAQSVQRNKPPPQNRQYGNNRQNRDNQHNEHNHQNRPKQKNQPNNRQRKRIDAKLPKFITFSENNSSLFSQFKFIFPKDKIFVIDFYPRAQVPVTYIDSDNESKLAKCLRDHKQSTVFVDVEWTSSNQLSIFEICSKKGVLLIHNSGKSDLIIEFLRTTSFYTKGSEKVSRLNNYVKPGPKLNIIDIDEKYINPKRYPRNFDYLLRTFLGDPNYNFRPKYIRNSNFSIKDLSCNQVMCCAYKVVSEFMLIPIIESAPKTIGEINYLPKQLEYCIQMPFEFDKNKVTKVTFIPDVKEENQFILPMIEKLYDGKTFITGSLDKKIYGYGTSHGILITQKRVSPFNHVKISISSASFDEDKYNSIIKKMKWTENDEIILLAFLIYSTIKENKIRPPDPVKGNAKFPSFAKYKPAKFDTPSYIPHKQIKSKFTILQIPVNPDLYIRFALPALESIQVLQEEGFNIPQARSFDIDEMCESVRIGDISDELELQIKKFIESFNKIDPKELQNLLKDIEPKSNEEDAYERIIESDDFSDLLKSDIKKLLSILDRSFEQRNKYITQLCSIKIEKKNAEMNSIMNELLETICPSDELVEKVNFILTKYDFDFNDYKIPLNKVLKHIQKMKNIENDQNEELADLYKTSLENLKQFVQKNDDCFDQIQLILKAFLNLKNFDSNSASPEEINLFVDNAKNMMNAVKTYMHFLSNHNYKPIRIIENLLFKLVFTPSDYEPFTQVYSVYQMHDKFLFNQDSFVNFKSSTGSGKTRCAPFFFSIKALMDKMKRPFFIMTQPGSSIIVDKMKDFELVLGRNNVILVNNIKKMMELYKKGKPSKPVVALLSPHNALRLLVEAENEGIDIISTTRFCLDEIHERSVDTDVFIAKLAAQMREKENFSLQVLMMSATPDVRVLNCFGRVKKLDLPDSHLFPIKIIKKEVDTKNSVSDEAASQTIQILKDMAHGNTQLGHILVFTSGNSRINEITFKIADRIEQTSKEIRKEIESSPSYKINLTLPDEDEDDDDFDNDDDEIYVPKMNKSKIIRNIKIVHNPPLTDIKEFYKIINDITKNDSTTLFVVLIKFAGFVSSAQKEIAKNVIKNHDNVIKIILATNAIESSITIDQLSAVVDTGIFNQPQFDTQRGLTKLSEEPISLQSQTQRQGRVGRVRPGISVQISIKNHPFKEFLPPDILTTDISSNILSLRKIGIKLESIENLPDKIDQSQMKMFMKELCLIGAIDAKTLELTSSGQKISQFESLSPFLAASIMKTASRFKSYNTLLEVLGSLIVLIFNSSDLIIDPYAEPLQDNFDSNSDIITILKTFLDLVNLKSWKLKAAKYGLNAKIAQGIFSTITNISENLKVPQEEKHIFIQLKEIIKRLDLMNFIQMIINTIEKFKSSWIQCRKATFMTIDNIRSTPSLIYNGDKSLAFDDIAQSEIMLSTRPGSKGLISPGAAYIFNISHNESMSINFGSCIHRNLKDDPIEKEETYKFVRPKILVLDIWLYAQEEFTSCLLNVLLEGYEDGFRKFNATKHTGIESGKIFFYPSIFKGKCIFTYAPISDDHNKAFIRALRRTITLLPYTPSTIIIRHQLLHCAIAVRFLTVDKPNSAVYFFNEKDCYPYQINKQTLLFMYKHAKELSCANNQIFIAITGEMLSIPLDSENNINLDSIRRPTVDPKCNYVFSDDSYFYNHMVILSDRKIPGQTPIPWTKDGIYADYAPSEYITKVANGIFPDLLNVKECEKLIFFINNNNSTKSQSLLAHDAFGLHNLRPYSTLSENQIIINGKYPDVLGHDEYLYLLKTRDRPVDAMFDRFAMGCINNNKLSQNVELNSFSVNGPKLPTSFIHYHLVKNALENYSLEEYKVEYDRNSDYFRRITYSKEHPDEFKRAHDELSSMKKRKSDIIEQQKKLSNVDWLNLSKEEKSFVKDQHSSLKSQRSDVENEISKLNDKINRLKIPPRPEIDPTFNQIFKFIKTPQEFEIAKKLTQTDYHISLINQEGEIALGMPNTIQTEKEKNDYIISFLKLISQFTQVTSYKKEEIPLYEVTFNHAKNSPLSHEEFRNRIENVCKKFGGIILRISKYKESNSSHNPAVQGHVYVYMFSASFTIPFASMSSDEIFGKNISVLRIPIQYNIDAYALAKDKKMCTIMKNWLTSNDLEIQFVHNKWIGPKSDVEKALELLKSSPPEFPTKTISIPGGVDLMRLNSNLRKQAKLGKKKWFVNVIRKTITVPSDTEEEKVKEFIEKYKQAGKQSITNKEEVENEDEDEIIGDVSYCGEEATLSTKLINVYNVENNEIQAKNFCRACIRDSLIYSLGKMFDENNDNPIMNKIFDNIDFIQPIPLFCSEKCNKMIPLGQLIWSFIADSDIKTPARTYITAIALQTLRKSPFITFCPQHPSIIFRKPKRNTELKCIVSSCDFHLCPNCNKWHKHDECPEKEPIPLGDRVCPFCHAVIEKSIACNHLHCNCGKHFCYYCGAGPWDSSGPCYSHLTEEHHDCFNDPPDYRRFIKHDNSVTDKELEEFYKKYPIWRNCKI